jgi:hypothetical protein
MELKKSNLNIKKFIHLLVFLLLFLFFFANSNKIEKNEEEDPVALAFYSYFKAS